jgi:hypothetical protein
LAGIILALVFWSRHPAVSLLTFISCLTFLIKALVIDWFYQWFPVMMAEQDLTPEQTARMYFIVGMSNTLVSALLWGLMLCAVFGWRRDPRRPIHGERPLRDEPPGMPGPAADIPYKEFGEGTEFREGRP